MMGLWGARARLFLALTLLAGCAAPPLYEIHPEARGLSPGEVVARGAIGPGRPVEWGGTIVAIHNRVDSTRIEVLGYPLDRQGRPRSDAAPQGRFLVIQPGYLEPADYAPGRMLTVYGDLSDLMEGAVGRAAYTYPVVEPRDIRLWPKPPEGEPAKVRFSIGIGFGF